MKHIRERLGGYLIPIVIGGIWVLGLLGFVGARQYTIRKASQRIQAGLPNLAYNSLKPFFWTLHSSADNCRLSAVTTFRAKKSDDLNWVAEACLESGIEIPELYLSLAGMREWEGRDQESLQILAQAAKRFENVSEVHLSLAGLLRKVKQENLAVQAAQKAAEVSGSNSQMALEALQFLIFGNHWAPAKTIADKLRTVVTEEPEVKLLLARVYAKNQEDTAKQALINEAKVLMDKKPERKEALFTAYSDVLGGAAVAQQGAPSVDKSPERSPASVNNAEGAPPAKKPQNNKRRR